MRGKAIIANSALGAAVFASTLARVAEKNGMVVDEREIIEKVKALRGEDKIPSEPPPEVAAQYSRQDNKRARVARYHAGARDMPEADRVAIEKAEAKRARKAQRNK